MKRRVTAYTLSYQNWTVIPHQMAEDFREMRDCGFTGVALSFSESELRYARRAFDLQVDLAHRAGLEVHLIPSRFGGRFAGAPLMPGLWIANHPECQVPADPALPWFAGPVAAVESAAFRDWCFSTIAGLLKDHAIDGIIWDEPKAVTRPSRHPESLAAHGEASRATAIAGFLAFFRDLVAHVAAVRPGLCQTLFVQPNDDATFTAPAARTPGLNYHGYDGTISRQSYFREEPVWHKGRIADAWARAQAEAAAAGVGTWMLVENILMPAAAHAEFAANLDAFLTTVRPDHLALYFYGHNNEDPEGAHAIMRAAMQRHL